MSSKTVFGLGLLCMGMLTGIALFKQIPTLETKLENKIEVALKSQGIDDVNARVSGLSVYIDLKLGATPPDRLARLKQAEMAILAISTDLPLPLSQYIPRSGGIIYGPVIEVIKDTRERPLSLSVGKTTNALSDL
jgi:hypothetical protein